MNDNFFAHAKKRHDEGFKLHNGEIMNRLPDEILDEAMEELVDAYNYLFYYLSKTGSEYQQEYYECFDKVQHCQVVLEEIYNSLKLLKGGVDEGEKE